MRQLASIQKIKTLEPIAGADAIEKATVLGWELVVKKGEFTVGQLCVYCEIDSLLPDRPEFEFLRPRGMRIRTVRLRGQLSQGICFPLTMLPAAIAVQEGMDVTDLLGIIKYEPPIPASLSGVMKGGFPSFIPKTDETRVQVLEDTLKEYEGTDCFVTEKLDGTSVTYYLREGEFGVCSRNLELLESEENSIWKVARELDLENKLRALGKNIALQGEMIGEGIQGNKYRLKGQRVYFFNVFDIDRNSFYDFDGFEKAIRDMDLQSVPVLNRSFALISNIAALVDMSVAESTLYPVQREGIVIRPKKEMRNLMGRVSFKAINPEFLLKYE